MHLIYADMTAGGARIATAREVLYDSRWTPSDIVFEGSQGILLDLRYGFFPHVTYGWLDAGNATALCRAAGVPDPLVVGCTRTYSTRHGNGPFPPEGTCDLPEVDNGTGVWQGAFRTGLMDLPMLEYGAGLVRPDVVSVSCLDTYPGSVITGWSDADGAEVHPSEYALAADDAIRREDDDDKWDPATVYAPLLAATPHIERMTVDDLVNRISTVSGAPVAVTGRGMDVDDWAIDALAEAPSRHAHEPTGHAGAKLREHAPGTGAVTTPYPITTVPGDTPAVGPASRAR